MSLISKIAEKFENDKKQEEFDIYSERLKKMFKGIENMDGFMNPRNSTEFKTKFVNKSVIKVNDYELEIDTIDELSFQKNLKFQEFLNKIENIKNFDVDSYIIQMEKTFCQMQEEIEMISNVRKNEQRLNTFLSNFNDGRVKQKKHREVLSSMIKIKDFKFDSQISSILNTD